MTAEDPSLACVQRVLDADNGRDARAYRALLHDDYHAEVNGVPAATNADDEVADLASTWSSFTDGRTELVEMWSTGTRVTLRYRFVGTNDRPLRGQPATDRRVDVSACTLLEVIDGKVKRVWRYVDTMSFLRQLGLLGG